VRPNFYCGQLLTDVDLDALVEWARQRFALSRYRDGWGIVCGLDVRCSAPDGARSCCGDETSSGPFVYVKPGYAIDCCGNDLVVCDPIRVDLGGICRDDDDPCAKPPKDPKDTRTPPPPRQIRALGGSDIWKSCVGEGEMILVDLFLRYHEDLRHGQRPLFGGKCGDERSCEYGRVAERPCVYAKLAEAQVEPVDPEVAFEERRKKALEEIKAAIDGGPRAIREYLRLHPIGQLCYLEDLRCCYAEIEGRTKTGKANEQKRAQNELVAMKGELMRWLYYDWFLQQRECPCPSCKPDDGVRIGRVALFRGTGPNGTCRVLMIYTDDDYRRLLRKDTCWVPKDRRDLRGYVGESRKQVEETLKDNGFRVSVRSDVRDLETLLSRPLSWAADAGEIELHVATDPLGVERVIAAIKK
jgi:hypothetical protein